jgi:hypothetical protein
MNEASGERQHLPVFRALRLEEAVALLAGREFHCGVEDVLELAKASRRHAIEAVRHDNRERLASAASLCYQSAREENVVRVFLLIAGLGALICCLVSCSSAPAGPEKGTPAFYWQAAKETFAAGDNMKTLEHLDKLTSSDTEYKPKALPWSLVLSSGLAAGYEDLAEQYEAGARANKTDPAWFRRRVSEYRTVSKQLSLQFADRYAKFAASKGETVPLAFGYPKGSATASPQLTRVSNGIVLPQADVDLALEHTVQRGVLMAACRAAGAPDDPAKAESILKAADPQAPRATFALAIANSLYNLSQIYMPSKADEPEKLKIFCERADEALKTVPPGKESKDLAAKIDKALKKKKT